MLAINNFRSVQFVLNSGRVKTSIVNMFNFWKSSTGSDLNGWSQEITFKVNGVVVSVKSDELSPSTSLNTFLRTKMNLFGTKFMCLEGGCGVCVVSLKRMHPIRKKFDQFAVNSCLYPALACDGAEIETIEYLKVNGNDEIPKRLAHFNGSQCGYCSPAMAMTMYNLMQRESDRVTMKEVENAFGGQLCRCTGYRPILDAFKSFALDADSEVKELNEDIEDLHLCKKTGKWCSEECPSEVVRKCYPGKEANFEWRKAASLQDVFDIFTRLGERKYMIVGGNTGHGVFRRDTDIEAFIDVNNVPELKGNSVNSGSLDVGGSVTLTEFMDILRDTSAKNQSTFGYLEKLAEHVEQIASIPVRNVGTIAGNLMLKQKHKEFPSDLFLILETVGAHVAIAKSASEVDVFAIKEFLSIEMNKKVVLKVILPARESERFVFKSYKIARRAQNDHAYVNAGFLIEFSSASDGTSSRIVKSARICYGGIEPEFVHASATETALEGSSLYENSTIQRAIATLNNNLNPDWVLPDASPDFRKRLAIGLFYKFILSSVPSDVTVNPKFKSGGSLIERPLSSGAQKFDTVEKNYPLTQPVMKQDALLQTSGEAVYHNDSHHRDDDLWCAFVLATEINASITSIDATEALALGGVVAFYTTKDIPGQNAFTGPDVATEIEELFVGDRVRHHSQPAGVIVAESNELAHRAAALVKIHYANPESKKLFMTIKDVQEDEEEAKKRILREEHEITNPKVEDISADPLTILGSFEIPSQYHFTMEPHTTICEPKEDGMDIYSATQGIDTVQFGISKVLNWPAHKLNLEVRRLGGGYGAKISRATHAACACALACYHLKRRVRFVMSLEQMMSAIGKRNAATSSYNVKVTPQGIITSLDHVFSSDFGCTLNDDPTFLANLVLSNVYAPQNWKKTTNKVLTDAPSSTWTRAPGALEGIAMIENIMEHIAFVINHDPVHVRLANLDTTTKMAEMFRQFLVDIEYDRRQSDIRDFNTANRWKKKGLAVVPMKYHLEYFGRLAALVSIYHTDGTVAISHGGIEMGQGLNTKACQAAAHALGIPLDMVTTKPSRDNVSTNAPATGGSQTSEVICFATVRSCEELNRRLQPVKDSAPPNTSWKDLIKLAFAKNIDLSAMHSWSGTETQVYDIYGLSACEVELDVLTGKTQLNRVDILEDTGESISPLIDVGQVEGGFVMGLGYWLTEHLVYNKQTGQLVTKNTWDYKVPGALDIPVDFRISFLQKSPNPFGVLRSKATGEPSICMSVVALFAIRHAIDSARLDNGLPREWYEIPIPCLPENILLLMGNKDEHCVL